MPGNQLHNQPNIASQHPYIGIATHRSRIAEIKRLAWAGSMRGPNAYDFIDKNVIQQKSSLVRLPTEILCMITPYLDLASASTFVHSCKSIAWKLGTQIWNDLKRHEKSYYRFIRLLVRDLPGYMVCRMCGKLHETFSSGKLLALSSVESFTLCRLRARSLYFCEHYALHYDQFQLVTRAQKRGLRYGIPADCLKHTCVDEWSGLQFDVKPSYTAKHGLQILKTLRLPFSFEDTRCEDEIVRRTDKLTHGLCKHLGPEAKYLWVCALMHEHPDIHAIRPCVYCNLPHRCIQCGTVYQVRVIKPKPAEKRCEVILTALLTLGHADPARYDRQWYIKHISLEYRHLAIWRRKMGTIPMLSIATI